MLFILSISTKIIIFHIIPNRLNIFYPHYRTQLPDLSNFLDVHDVLPTNHKIKIL